jgi:hypothetical protein
MTLSMWNILCQTEQAGVVQLVHGWTMRPSENRLRGGPCYSENWISLGQLQQASRKLPLTSRSIGFLLSLLTEPICRNPEQSDLF